MRTAYLIMISAALAGCSTITSERSERRVVYNCNYGPDLTVTYAGPTATIASSDGTVTLRQRPAASGFLYESTTHSLHGSGGEIVYKDRQMAPKSCRAT